MFEEALIKEVRRLPYLYDLSNPSYKRTELKESAWTDISKRLGKPVSICKSRWKSLRDHFRKLNRKSGTEEPRTKWPYFEKLLFLRKVMDVHPTVNSLGSSQESSDGEECLKGFSVEESLSPKEVTSPSTVDQFQYNFIITPSSLPEPPTILQTNLVKIPPVSAEFSQPGPVCSTSNVPGRSTSNIQAASSTIPEPSISDMPPPRRHPHAAKRPKRGDELQDFLDFMEVAKGRLGDWRQQESPREVIFKAIATKIDRADIPDHIKDELEIEIQRLVYEKITVYRRS